MTSEAADVVVVGAGAAGMAAAIAAARGGARVLLVERRATVGGTVAHALIHTLGGLHDSEGALLNPGLPAELVERLERADRHTRTRRIGKMWTLSVDPGVYGRVTSEWLVAEGVRVSGGSTVTQVHRRGGKTEGLTVLDAEGVARQVACGAVVDCTGTAEVVRLVDPALVIDDDDLAAAGLIFRIGHVPSEALVFPRTIEVQRRLQRAAAEGELPSACAKAWVDVGVVEGDAYVKLFVPMAQRWRAPGGLEEMTRTAVGWRDAVLAVLRGVPAFAGASLEETGELGVRDGGRIVGDVVLTVDDVRSARTFPDAACRCQWPIEYWHPKEGVQLEFLPPGASYQIPRRALQVRGDENLWSAGKCLSAEPRARASARVVGCCWGMGEAAGLDAASGRRR